MEYRFDGLRFDAVHAIEDQSWVDEMAATVRRTVEPGRHVHLVLETPQRRRAPGARRRCAVERRRPQRAARAADRRGRRLLRRLRRPTGADKLARCLAEGWVYQGEHSRYLGGVARQPQRPPAAHRHVLFLQNHDQTGNRAFGERLTALADPAALEAATALLLLARRSRCCSWARKPPAARPSCSSPTTTAGWRMRCATAGAEFARFPPSPTRRRRTASPTRTPRDLPGIHPRSGRGRPAAA